MLSKVSQTEKDKCVWFHLYVESEKTKQMNKHNKTEIDSWIKRTLVHSWWECKLVQPLWKTVWRFLKKLKIELPYDPAILLLGIYVGKKQKQKQKPPLIWKDMCTPMFKAAFFTISKIWKQPKCPSTDEWIKKMWYTHTHTHTHRLPENVNIRLERQENILPCPILPSGG